MPTFDYTVDDEPLTTAAHDLTPTQILQAAGLDPATHYLIEVTGQAQHSYENQPSADVHMHQHAKFISVFSGPTPVS